MSTLDETEWPTGPQVADHLEAGGVVRFVGDPREGAAHPPDCGCVPDEFDRDSQHLDIWRLLELPQPGYVLVKPGDEQTTKEQR